MSNVLKALCKARQMEQAESELRFALACLDRSATLYREAGYPSFAATITHNRTSLVTVNFDRPKIGE